MEFGTCVRACWGERKSLGRQEDQFPHCYLWIPPRKSPWCLVFTHQVLRQGYLSQAPYFCRLSQPGLRAGQLPWRCPAWLCRSSGAGRQQPRPPWGPVPPAPGSGTRPLPPPLRSRARDAGGGAGAPVGRPRPGQPRLS